MLTINYYTDPGHGWAACKMKTLQALGIADQVSHYSYARGRTAYLEEDCDFGLLINALRSAGVEFQIVEKHTDRRHPIRSYDHYIKPDPVAAAIVARTGIPAGRLIVSHVRG